VGFDPKSRRNGSSASVIMDDGRDPKHWVVAPDHGDFASRRTLGKQGGVGTEI